MRVFRIACVVCCTLVAFCWASAPFEARASLDIPMALGATAGAAYGQYRLSGMEPISSPYARERLLPWDRPVAGNWNPTAAKASDLMSLLGVYPLVLGGVSWHRGDIGGGDFATQALMLYEALALQSGINLTVRSLRVWPRPFTLGDQGGEERLEGQASGSFYSGHSSAAFAIAVFSGVWFDEVYPHSRWSPLVWGAGLASAVTVASLRVVAGKHYPTDVVVGAAVGSLIGWAVPALHRHSAGSSREETGGAVADRGWLKWKGWSVAPDYLGWQCRF